MVLKKKKGKYALISDLWPEPVQLCSPVSTLAGGHSETFTVCNSTRMVSVDNRSTAGQKQQQQNNQKPYSWKR